MKHSTLVGVVLGWISGALIYASQAPIYYLALAPLISALTTGSVRTGAKNGWLTFIIPSVVLTILAIAQIQSPSSTTIPNNPVAVLLYAWSSSMSQIMTFLILLIVGIMFVLGSIVSLILGAIGGTISRIYIKKPKEERMIKGNLTTVTKIVCPKCGTENDETAEFCGNCGAKQA
jgi:succinate dehydrogenase hydrophobic anchor subunit